MHKRKNNLLAEFRDTITWYLYFEAVDRLDRSVTTVKELIAGIRIVWATRSGPCLHPFYCCIRRPR